MYSGNQLKQLKLGEFAVRKIHSITDAFFSLIGTERSEDVDLLVKVSIHSVLFATLSRSVAVHTCSCCVALNLNPDRRGISCRGM